MGKYILLGGAGFIGQNLARLLLTTNNQIIIYDRNISEKILDTNILEKCQIVEGNFFEDNNLGKYVNNVDCVVHLISSVSPQTSMCDIYSGYEKDIKKAIELCELCKNNSIKRIVFISSGGTIYGNGNINIKKYSEDMQTNPINNYGIIKLTIEKILLMYNEIYNMENIILRVSNPYGVWQNPQKNIGIISVFLDSIMKDKEVIIYGDGNTIRDYVEIDDVCKAIESVISYKFKQDVCPIFNIGSGVGHSINDILKTIEKITEKHANVEYLPSRAIDVKSNVLDINKAKKILNYTCNTDIESGIRKFIEQKESLLLLRSNNENNPIKNK